MKKQVKDILAQIVRDTTESSRPRDEAVLTGQGITSLGVPLSQLEDGSFFIDLTSVRIFTGITTFIQMLTGEVMDQCLSSSFDVWVKYKIDSRVTPELAAAGITHVCIYSRNSVSRQLAAVPEKFSQQMLHIFSNIQISRWGGLLFPEYFGISQDDESRESSTALLFPFHLQDSSDREEDGYFFLVENEKSSGFLRITIEDSRESRLQLRHIRHRVVAHLDREDAVCDFACIAEAVFRGILLELRNDRDIYVETESQQAGILRMLHASGYGSISTLTFHWPLDKMDVASQESQTRLIRVIAKTILLLTDKDILGILASGGTLEMASGEQHAYLELSHRGMYLNISLGEKRQRLTMNYFLERMPQVKEFTEQHAGVLQGTRMFLIHHITAEVLGMIKSVQEMGCSALHTFFIKYAGIVPVDYLEAILTLPEEKFRFHSLQQTRVRTLITGNFRLSREYSSIEGLESLDGMLQGKKTDFFSAMKLASGHLFFREAILCQRSGEKLMLVEDGGYLAPVINQLCLDNRSLGEVLQAFSIFTIKADGNVALSKVEGLEELVISENEQNMLLYDWLRPFFIGSAEVTRNGHNRLVELMDNYHHLSFPACSIAISDLKRGWEARENSVAIIGAAEAIMGSMGLIISQRRALVFGCRGAIGSNIMNDLSCKMGKENVAGVDIVIDPETYQGKKPNRNSEWIERRTIDELPKEVLYNTDLFIGVIGTSILSPDLLEEILLNSRRSTFIFVSGSTKTLEFEHLTDWLNSLSNKKEPKIGGIPVSLEIESVRDPQTRVSQGRSVRVTFHPDTDIKPGTSLTRNLYLFADLMPINFLYYGTPCEVTDHVMKQLIQVSVGLVRQCVEKENHLPPQLLSVDHQIDADVNQLPAREQQASHTT